MDSQYSDLTISYKGTYRLTDRTMYYTQYYTLVYSQLNLFNINNIIVICIPVICLTMAHY